MTPVFPDDWQPAVPFDQSFDAQYGLEIVSVDVHGEGRVEGRFVVREELFNRFGTVHGGVFAAATEALASRGTAVAVMPHGQLAMGLSNDTTVVSDVKTGAIHVHARVRAHGDDAWHWTVDAVDDDGRLCAVSHVTVTVR